MTKACKSGLDVNPFGREVLHIEGTGVAQASWHGDLPVCAVALSWTPKQVAGSKPLIRGRP